nr:MAG TPA: hypothetical protein [Caudoviricetes sp.]
MNAKFCKLAGCWLAKFFCPLGGGGKKTANRRLDSAAGAERLKSV